MRRVHRRSFWRGTKHYLGLMGVNETDIIFAGMVYALLNSAKNKDGKRRIASSIITTDDLRMLKVRLTNEYSLEEILGAVNLTGLPELLGKPTFAKLRKGQYAHLCYSAKRNEEDHHLTNYTIYLYYPDASME